MGEKRSYNKTNSKKELKILILLDCKPGNTDPVNNIKSITDTAEGYRAGISFNRANHNNAWNSNYGFDLDRFRYCRIRSHELGGFA